MAANNDVPLPPPPPPPPPPLSNQNNKTVGLNLTGFGPFLNVSENPSSTIMQLVAKHFQQQQQNDNNNNNNNKSKDNIITDETDSINNRHHRRISYVVESTAVLEVSVQAVSRFIDQVVERENSHENNNHYQNNNNSATKKDLDAKFFIHFGVNRSARSTIAVETVGQNCVSLPAGDHSGFNHDVIAAPVIEEKRSKQHDDHDEFFRNVEKKTQSQKQQDDETKAHSKDGAFSADTPGDVAVENQTKQRAQLSSCYISTLVTSLDKSVREICSHLSPFRAVVARSCDGDLDVDVDDANTTTKGEEQRQAEATVITLQPSVNAGAYLCNFIFFLSLLKLSNDASGRSVGRRDYSLQPSLFRAWEQSPPFLLQSNQHQTSSSSSSSFASSSSGKNDEGKEGLVVVQQEPMTKKWEEEEEEEEECGRHSLFIHVLDPSRCSEEVQAREICRFLEELVEKCV